jgi:predicted outer membrane repeat protein
MHPIDLRLRRTLASACLALCAFGAPAFLAPGVASAAPSYTVTYAAGTGGVDAGAASDLNDCSQESTPCATLAGALAQTSPGGTVYVSGTIDETSTAYVNSAVTIAANPAGTSATIVGAGLEPSNANAEGLIYIQDSGAVTLSGLTLEHGYSQNTGGAVYAGSASLTVEGCTFLDNSAQDGGAIASADANSAVTLTVANSTFSDNTAAGSGGAISTGTASGTGAATITSTSFTSNQALGGGGGAIDSAGDGGKGTLTVSDSSFTDNASSTTSTATYAAGGGAIASGTVLGDGTLTVTDSSFTANTTTASGGAIASGNDGQGALTVTGSTFTGNSASNASLYGGGGAILSGDDSGQATASISGSSFTDNTDAGNGGAIDSGDYDSLASLSVSDSSFTGNTATHEDGGAIDSGDGDGREAASRRPDDTLTVTGSTFAANSAGIDGGAIDNGDRTGLSAATVSYSTFTANASGPGSEGGAIDNGDGGGNGDLTLLYSTFAGNTAPVTPSGVSGAALASGANGGAATIQLAGNVIDGSCWDAGGVWNDVGFNATTSNTCTGTPPSTAPDLVSSAVGELGPLAANGGPTQTLALLAGNPAIGLIPRGTAIELGDSATGEALLACPLSADQRGDTSPASGPCDAGAVQYAGQSVSFSSSVPSGATAGGASYSLSASSSSGLPVSFSVDPSTTNAACAVDGTTVIFLHAGSCVIDATSPQTANFAGAQASQTIAVAAAVAATPPASGAPATGIVVTKPSSRSPHIRVLDGYRVLAGDRLAVPLACSLAPCRGLVKVVVTRLVTVHRGRRRLRRRLTVVLGRARFLIAPASTRRVLVALDAVGRHELALAGARGLHVRILATAVHGNSYGRAVTLRRPRRRRRR